MPGIYDTLMDGLLGKPEDFGLPPGMNTEAARRNARMAMAASLLQASGPSEQKRSFLQNLGGGIMAGRQAGAESADQAVRKQFMAAQIQAMLNKQKDLPSAVEEYEFAKRDGFKGTFEEWKRVASAQPQSPSAIQEYEYFQKLDPEQRKQFLSLQRTPVLPQLGMVNGVLSLIDRTNESVTPLSTQESEIEAARRRKEAEAAGAAEGKVTGARTGKAPTAYAAYQAGIKSLEGAMAGTNTGPVSGRLPALTAAQQTAEGAEATMAPVLKQLFRDSGEGTFTDADQALLMKMVPKRTDHPETRKAKIEMLDEIVRAKLGIAGSDTSGGGSAPPAAIEHLRKNPQLKEAFKAKYGYVPDGI
jgi:hypothetical protein